MSLWTPDFFVDEGEVGIDKIAFANALQVWSGMQDRRTTVAEAALAFNTTIDVVREAVEEHPWMLLSPPDAAPDEQAIEHEGE